MVNPKQQYYNLAFETIVDVYAIKEKEVFKHKMTFKDWLFLKKNKGFKYIAYQEGFASFSNVKEI